MNGFLENENENEKYKIRSYLYTVHDYTPISIPIPNLTYSTELDLC